MEWFSETVKDVPKKKWLYKTICFFARRKLSYKELYLIFLEINGGNKAEESSKPIKEKCLNELVKVYQYNENKIPEEMKEYVR